MTNIDFSLAAETINTVYWPIFTERSRLNILFGGAGSGKSYAIAQKLVYRMVTEPGHNYLVVRKVARMNRFSTWPLVKRVFSDWKLKSLCTFNETEMRIKCINGNECVFAGLDDVDKLKSITFEAGDLTDVWIEEASEVTANDYDELNTRLRGHAPFGFQITLSLNPIDINHWIKKDVIDHAVGRNVYVLKTTYLDNRFIDENYKKELESYKERNPYRYQVYALGEWGVMGDLVFRSVIFEPCRYKPEQFDHILCGQDFGYNHYNAIELIGMKDGHLYSFRELYVREHTVSDVIAVNGKQDILSKGQLCVCDSAEPKSIEEWRRSGYRVTGAKKGADSIRAGIDFLNSRVWHIDPVACPGLAAEVRGFSWRKDRNDQLTDEGTGAHDDAIAACRYAIEHLLTQMKARPKFTDQQVKEILGV